MGKSIQRVMYMVMRRNRSEVWGEKASRPGWLPWPGIGSGMVRLYETEQAGLGHRKQEDGPFEVVRITEILKVREDWER